MKHWKRNIGILVVAYALFSIGDFYVHRWFHYKTGYQDYVRSDIRSLVKESCLKEP